MKLRFLLTVPVVLFAAAVLLSAQTTNTGAIVGSVTDPSGLVVPGTAVTVRNLGTNFAREVTTNNQGDYRVEFLNPGMYEIVFRREGFESATISQVKLNVGQILRTDLQLKVGTMSASVTVTAAPVPLDTENGARGTVVQSDELGNLPLNGRNFLQLLELSPGAVVGAEQQRLAAVGTSFNGSRSTYNAFSIDGAYSTDPQQNTLVTAPPLDAIQEFRMETSSYPARYGNAAGSVVSVVTKSGTNQFHGSAYDYHRNKVLDALPWKFNGPRSSAPNYLFNQFGFTFGGPIHKDKTFFFTNLEFMRQRPPASRQLSFAPNAAERTGDARNSRNPWTGGPVVLTDPYTTDAAGNPVEKPEWGGILPASLISPVGKKLMSLWPEPNIPGADPFFNLQVFRAGKITSDKWVTRIDHHFDAHNILYGSFMRDTSDSISAGLTPYQDTNALNHGETGIAHYTRIISPTAVNDLSFNFESFNNGTKPALADKSYGVEWGMDPSSNKAKGAPWLVVFGGPGFLFGNGPGTDHINHTLDFQDNLQWAKGSHSLQFGGGFTRQYYNWQSVSGMNQPFMGLLDGLPGLGSVFGVTGWPIGDVLAALPNVINSYGGGGEYAHFLRNRVSAYVQDDWKVSSRLVLNLGVRYDYSGPFKETDNKYMTLNFKTGYPIFAADAPGLEAITFPHETGGRNRAHDPNYFDFAPRFGFAWRPFGGSKTVIRGGYGIFFTSEEAYTMQTSVFVNPWGGPTSWLPKKAAGPWPDGDHFVTLAQPPYQMEKLRGRSVGGGSFIPDYYPTGYVEQWNLTLGRSLGSDMGLEVAYVGSQGINLNSLTLLITSDPALYFKANKIQQDAVGLGWGPTIHRKGFNSNYHALQAGLRRRFSHGLSFQAAWTWSHALADASSNALSDNLLPEYTANVGSLTHGITQKRFRANADFDVTHRFSFSGEYQLPVGRGKTFGNKWNAPLDKVLGGWSLHYIYTFQTGFPFTMFVTSQNLPDRICDGKLANPTAAKWVDYNCFPTHPPKIVIVDGAPVQTDTQGNSGINILRGPHANNLDLGVHKTIGFRERWKLEIRAEAFNLPNIVNLRGPSQSFFVNTPGGSQIPGANRMRDVQVAAKLFF